MISGKNFTAKSMMYHALPAENINPQRKEVLVLSRELQNLVHEASKASNITPQKLETDAVLHYIKCHLGSHNQEVSGLVISYEIHNPKKTNLLQIDQSNFYE